MNYGETYMKRTATSTAYIAGFPRLVLILGIRRIGMRPRDAAANLHGLSASSAEVRVGCEDF